MAFKKQRIPHFKEFAEIHAALGLKYKSPYSDIDLFSYDEATDCHDIIPPYRTSFYQIFFIHDSNLTGNYNDTQLHFSRKHSYLFFACPGKMISWEKTGQLHGYIFSFKPSYMARYMSISSFLKKFKFFNPDTNSALPLSGAADRRFVRKAFEHLRIEWQTGGPDSFELIFHYLSGFLIGINRLLPHPTSRNEPQGKKTSLLTTFEALVSQHLSKKHGVSWYAARMHVTPKSLSETLKKEDGRSASIIIQDILILEAKTLLLQTDLPVADIGSKLGFSDSSHFIKLFKRRVNMTPATFRKKK